MIDHNTLSLIKPKRLYEDKTCCIVDNQIEMELGATKIIAPFVSKLPPVKFKVKDLWSANLDAAEYGNFKLEKLPDFELWHEIPISVADVTVFSSLSSVGEDTFFLGSIGFSASAFQVHAIGFTWALQYRSPKVITGLPLHLMAVDWNVFYYLFQMFKELTGKKIGTLYWNLDHKNIYFTNQNKEYFVVCPHNNKDLKYRAKYKEVIFANFMSPPLNTKSVDKKSLQTSANTEVKHLLRPFGDIVTVDEVDNYYRYRSDSYTLCTTKEKK